MMYRKLFQLVALVVILLLGSVIILSQTPSVRAENLLQEAPSLSGYKIYFTEATGESSRFDRSAEGISRFAGLLTDLGADLQTLEWRTSFPTDADLIIIAGPRQDFDPGQTARLWTYMSEGGKVLMLAEPLRLEDERARGLTQDSGLMQLLWTDLGIRFSNNLVTTEGFSESQQPTPVAPLPVVEITAEAGAETTETPIATDTTTQTPVATATQSLSSPPIVNFTTTEIDANHPILQGITDPLAFFGARSIEIDLSIREFPVEPIVFSNINFYGEYNIPVYYENGLTVYNLGEDTPSGFLPLAAAFQSGDTDSRLVFISDRDFATNGGGLQSSPPNTGAFLYPGNVRFLLNSIAWMLNTNPVAVSFPTPGPTSTPTPVPTLETIDPLDVQTDLSITMSVTNIRPVEGEIIIYSITVLNRGPETALNIVVTDELPRGLDFILSSGGIYNSENDRWLIEELLPNEAVTLRLVVGVIRGTVNSTITNAAQVSSDALTDTDTNNNITTLDIEVSGVGTGESSLGAPTPVVDESQEGG
jgi:uncharacterized repeat protein (TIGR01451 family)